MCNDKQRSAAAAAEDKVITVVIVEYHHHNDTSTTTTSTIKREVVRIQKAQLLATTKNKNKYRNDTDNDENIECTGEDLYTILTQHYKKEEDDEKKEARIEASSNITQHSDAFLSLLDESVKNVDVRKRFGSRRLRCIYYSSSYLQHQHQHQNIDEDDNNNNDKPPPKYLAIAGRYYPYDPKVGLSLQIQNNNKENEAKKKKQKTVIVEENVNQGDNSTANNVWDGAILLTRYLEMFPDKVRKKRILELGSGTGLVGISSFFLGASNVVITDLSCALPLMEHNIQLNCSSTNDDDDGCCAKINDQKQHHHRRNISCAECDWFDPPHIKSFGFSSSGSSTTPSNEVDHCNKGNNNNNKNDASSSFPSHPPPPPDVILVADCVWLEELVIPLIQTLDLYTSSSTNNNNNTNSDTNCKNYAKESTTTTTTTTSTPKIIMTYQQRGRATHDLFWTRIHSLFYVQEIDTSKFGLYKPDVLYVLECQKRNENI